ncbi:MAG: NAD(P)H-quinone oxidoreductase [Actinomyces sp.]|nr:MAG: NAD(P)H-quinone oxidoreductase [Actinomyces sp.]
MKAVVLDGHGGPEVLTWRDVPDPVPGPDEILVDVVTTAVNRADLLQRLGLYPGPPAAVEIPGLEFAGRVAGVGERVRSWSVGDEVMGIVGGGAYAQRLVVHERQAIAVPDSLPLTEAGAVPEVFITAWDALVVQGGLTSGRWALVHAGASGVGTAAIQIARAIGARTIVTASAAKHGVCASLGTDVVVDYRSEDFVEICERATGGVGVDVVLDVVGGDYLPRNVRCLRVGGTIVQVGVMAGGPTSFDVGSLLPRRARLIGTVLRARPLEEKIAVSRRFADEVVPLFDAGRLAPVIDSRYPLEQVAEAHRRMEANANAGKIVLDVAPA